MLLGGSEQARLVYRRLDHPYIHPYWIIHSFIHSHTAMFIALLFHPIPYPSQILFDIVPLVANQASRFESTVPS